MSEQAYGTCVACGQENWLYDDGQCWYCRRDQRDAGYRIGKLSEATYDRCRVCGASLADKRADAQTCSDGCRQKLHRVKNAGHEKYCAVCDKQFTSKRADKETCSNKCRQALYRIRKQQEEPFEIGYDIPSIKVDE